MQSGIYRGHYGKEGRRAHKGALRGVETDLCNQRVITVGADDKLKFWHFKDGMIFYWFLHYDDITNAIVLQSKD